ncbi:hypothetical protein ACFYM3_00075 [Streptomyces massasporeus]|uniref:Transposase n=1 Tax=Streptomyces massasporeus TaxID=67324 RepID=A0ABW6L3E7_9ACTN
MGRRRHLGEKVFTALLPQADAEGALDWDVTVDSTIVRAHQHAAGAHQKGLRPVRASRATPGPRRSAGNQRSPGAPVTHEDIVNGRIPAKDGRFQPPAIQIR